MKFIVLKLIKVILFEISVCQKYNLIKLISANKSGEDSLMNMEAKIVVTLDVPDDKIVLETCAVYGQVGHTQLLVSETDYVLHANTPCLLAIRNAGVVPLDLQLIATHVENSNVEPRILIEPAKLTANPGEDITLRLLWNPSPGEEFNIVNRYVLYLYCNFA